MVHGYALKGQAKVGVASEFLNIWIAQRPGVIEID